jgi:hypothetical protein
MNQNTIIEEKEQKENINRGTGAGGTNTNKNGLLFEDKIDLGYPIINNVNELYNIIVIDLIIKHQFIGYNLKHMKKKSYLIKYMEEMKQVSENTRRIGRAQGCKHPDDVLIYEDKNNKILFIIEKKYQKMSGSTSEKIQTGGYKRKQYEIQYPNYKIHYIYILSDFLIKTMKPELDTMYRIDNITYFHEDDYKERLTKFIVDKIIEGEYQQKMMAILK